MNDAVELEKCVGTVMLWDQLRILLREYGASVKPGSLERNGENIWFEDFSGGTKYCLSLQELEG